MILIALNHGRELITSQLLPISPILIRCKIVQVLRFHADENFDIQISDVRSGLKMLNLML